MSSDLRQKSKKKKSKKKEKKLTNYTSETV